MRRALVILILLVSVATVRAQRTVTPDLSVGAKAGATISFMSFSPSITQAVLPGFMAGVVVRYTEEKIFGLIGEINIEQRGWR